MNIKKTFLLAVGLLAAVVAINAQSMEKRYKTIEVSRVLPFNASTVWQTVAVDYGRIAQSHPQIVASDYEQGSLVGELGAFRKCSFNERGTKVLHEQIVDWSDEDMQFTNRVLTAQNFPVDPDNSRGIYKVEPIDANSSRLSITFQYRTKPAFMAGMVKGSFKKILNNYMIAVEHHIATGEAVTKENFKNIKKQYVTAR